MKRATGIGGIFFNQKIPSSSTTGTRSISASSVNRTAREQRFTWRGLPAADGGEPGLKGLTAWSIFPQTTKYFGASKAGFMVNYRVDNLDALLEDLKQSGVEVDPHREGYDYGRFAWITDPDGNRIELWEQPKPEED